MRHAVIYARVSSKDQEKEGFSIPAQLKLLQEYAAKHGFKIVREFIDVETAKCAGRKQFGEMVKFFEKNPGSRVVLVEKTDRLYRNFRDCVTLEDLAVEIHLPKEGQIIDKDAKSQAKLVHGIQLVIARNYIEKPAGRGQERAPGKSGARSVSWPCSLRLSLQSADPQPGT